MATTILLIRHAPHDRPGPLLVGRDDTVDLSAAGREQARRLAQRLAGAPLAAILTSPSRRCQSTADMLAVPHGLTPEVEPDLDEMDFGAWRGRPFAELADDPAWRLFNLARASACIPGGETVAAVQVRVGRALHRIAQRHPRQAVALVSHGDVIRTALCQVLALAPDLMLRFEVWPASVSTVVLDHGGPRLLTLNWRPEGWPGVPD